MVIQQCGRRKKKQALIMFTVKQSMEKCQEMESVSSLSRLHLVFDLIGCFSYSH